MVRQCKTSRRPTLNDLWDALEQGGIVGKVRTSTKAGGRLVEWDGYAVPRSVSSTFENDDGPAGTAGPDYVADFEIRDGNAECVKITVTAKPRGRGIRTPDLGILNVEALTQRAFLDVAYRVIEPGHAYAYSDRPDAISGARRAIGRHVGRESGALLREVARLYLADGSGHGIKAVYEGLDVPRSTAARRIDSARKEGLIPAVGASEVEKAEALARLIELAAAESKNAADLEKHARQEERAKHMTPEERMRLTETDVAIAALVRERAALRKGKGA